MAKLEELGQESKKCDNCKEKDAEFLYTWAIGGFNLCRECAEMIKRNISKDLE